MRPNKITVELNEKDIKEDIGQILSAMSKIRSETLTNNACDDKQKDEYLHLTYRLASGIEAISDTNLANKLDKAVKFIDKDSRLLWYDSSQDDYWKKHKPDFNRTLEKIVISTLRDDFNSLDNKHHVLQAIKFLGVVESDFEEKEKVYGTIMPFNGKVRGVERKTGIHKLIGKLLGYSYKIEEDKDLTLRLKGNPKFIEDAIEQIKELGYNSLQIDMYEQDFMELTKKISNTQIIGDIKKSKLKTEQSQKTKELTQSLIRYTTPISYPLLGSLPRSLLKRIRDYTDGSDDRGYAGQNLGNFCPKYATSSSIIVELASGVGAVIPYWIINSSPLNVGTAIGAYALVEGLVRSLFYGNRKYLGSIPFELAGYPLKKILDYKEDKTNKRGSFCRVDIKLRNRLPPIQERLNNVPANIFDYFSKVARIEVPRDMEDSLVWSTNNHHSYAKQFASFLDSKIQGLEQKPSFEQNTDRKNQRYNLTENKTIGDYRKFTTLACSKGERYILSLINHNKNQQDCLEIANEILFSKISTLEKAEKITDRLVTEYTHLTRFENGDIVGDYEVVS